MAQSGTWAGRSARLEARAHGSADKDDGIFHSFTACEKVKKSRARPSMPRHLVAHRLLPLPRSVTWTLAWPGLA